MFSSTKALAAFSSANVPSAKKVGLPLIMCSAPIWKVAALAPAISLSALRVMREFETIVTVCTPDDVVDPSCRLRSRAPAES